MYSTSDRKASLFPSCGVALSSSRKSDVPTNQSRTAASDERKCCSRYVSVLSSQSPTTNAETIRGVPCSRCENSSMTPSSVLECGRGCGHGPAKKGRRGQCRPLLVVPSYSGLSDSVVAFEAQYRETSVEASSDAVDDTGGSASALSLSVELSSASVGVLLYASSRVSGFGASRVCHSSKAVVPVASPSSSVKRSYVHRVIVPVKNVSGVLQRDVTVNLCGESIDTLRDGVGMGVTGEAEAVVVRFSGRVGGDRGSRHRSATPGRQFDRLVDDLEGTVTVTVRE
jgi:hypothetical protein